MTKVCLTALFVFAFALTAAAQTAAPKSVTDFYYLLPDKFFTPYYGGTGEKPDVRAYRRSIIEIEDVKNGYLRLSGQWEGWADVAIFKKTKGGYVVGISLVGCGPVCGSEKNFLVFENGEWRDVTDEVLPKITDAQFQAAYRRHQTTEEDDPGVIYELPRTGTTIKVVTDGFRNAVLFELNWNGARFILKEK